MAHPSNRLPQFFALTFAWSWTCWLLTLLVKTDSNFAANALFFVGGFGPSLAALILVRATNGRNGLHAWLGKCLQWRFRFLFSVAGSAQNQGSIAAFFVLILATSVFFTWLYYRSAGSLLPVLVLHTASNWWPNVFPILPSDTDQRPYLLVVGIVVVAAVWLLLRRDTRPLAKGLA